MDFENHPANPLRFLHVTRNENEKIVTLDYNYKDSTQNFLNIVKPGTVVHKKIYESSTILAYRIFIENLNIQRSKMFFLVDDC